MKTVLYITASARQYHPYQQQHQSISRMLGESFIHEFKRHHKQTEIIYRDLSTSPPAYIDQEFIAASFAQGELNKAQQAVLAESDLLINEIEQADVIVMASPMYNYGMPAVLKAWFDQIIRIGKTFSFDLSRGDEPLAPVLSGKHLVLLASWGEFNSRKGETKYAFNHLSSHIEQLSPYLGADTFNEIASEYQEFGDSRHEESKAQAISETRTLAKHLALL